MVALPPTKKNMTISQRMACFLLMFDRSKDGAPPHGIFREMAAIFGVNSGTISNLWRETSKKIDEKLKEDENDSPHKIDVFRLIVEEIFWERPFLRTIRMMKRM